MTKINQKEYWLLKSLDDKWKWITRDSYRDEKEYENVLGGIRVFSKKPFKGPGDRQFGVDGTGMGIDWLYLDRDKFFFIKPYDEEPYEISELIEEYEEHDFYDYVGWEYYKSEETEVKSKQELIEKWELAIESAEFYGKGKEVRLIGYMEDFVSDLKQLEEPEELADKEKEPETVGDVLSTFWKSLERFKKVMSMEVEELEE